MNHSDTEEDVDVFEYSSIDAELDEMNRVSSVHTVLFQMKRFVREEGVPLLEFVNQNSWVEFCFPEEEKQRR